MLVIDGLDRTGRLCNRNSISTSDSIRRDGLFLGKGSFYDRNVVVLEEDVEEQEE